MTDRYSELRRVLDLAYQQASAGKGHERHDKGEPFQQQQICQIGRWQGSIDFNVGQACKKSLEAKVLAPDRAIAELLGAINYLAAGVLLLEEECGRGAQILTEDYHSDPWATVREGKVIDSPPLAGKLGK